MASNATYVRKQAVTISILASRTRRGETVRCTVMGVGRTTLSIGAAGR